MASPGIICIELVVQWYTLFLYEYFLSDLHGVQESLWDVSRLFGRREFAIVSIEVRGTYEGNKWSSHCASCMLLYPLKWGILLFEDDSNSRSNVLSRRSEASFVVANS